MKAGLIIGVAKQRGCKRLGAEYGPSVSGHELCLGEIMYQCLAGIQIMTWKVCVRTIDGSQNRMLISVMET